MQVQRFISCRLLRTTLLVACLKSRTFFNAALKVNETKQYLFLLMGGRLLALYQWSTQLDVRALWGSGQKFCRLWVAWHSSADNYL